MGVRMAVVNGMRLVRRMTMMRFVRSRPRLRFTPAMAVGVVRIHARAILKPPPLHPARRSPVAEVVP
jgi:hypothetical protein